MKEIETRGDEILFAATEALFSGKYDALNVIKLRDIHKDLENALKKNYVDFSEAVKAVLTEKLDNHPVIKSKMDEIEKFDSICEKCDEMVCKKRDDDEKEDEPLDDEDEKEEKDSDDDDEDSEDEEED